MPSDYDYYLLDGLPARVPKISRLTAELMTPTGEWVPYEDPHQVQTAGRLMPADAVRRLLADPLDFLKTQGIVA